MTYRYEEPLKKFTKDMKRKLRANVHKSHWKYDLDMQLLEKLDDEISELEDAILKEGNSEQDIIDECADVANFAMMIADNARRRMKK